MNQKGKCAMLLASTLAGALPGRSPAQTPDLCTAREAAAKWPIEHDAVLAAPANHRVIYETDQVRVLEVTVAPGERENLHHHQWPSVLIVDSRPKYINFDRNGKEIPPAIRGNPALPVMVRLPAQAEHAIQNVDTRPFHAFRIEYKTLCQTP